VARFAEARPYTASPVPATRLRRRVLAAVPVGLAATLLGAPAAHAGLLFPEEGGSPNANSIHTLYVMVFILALIIFIGVEGTLIYSFFRFRARKGRVAAQIHGNTRLEIGWTVGAALVLIFITAFTFIKLPSIKDPKPSLIGANGGPIAQSGMLLAATDRPSVKGPTLNLRVDGQQYVWRYQYPGLPKVFSYHDMYVPVGITVLLDITSDDVAHSWWIPKLGGKMDAVPGYVNRTWFRIPPDAIPSGQRQVIFTGQCAELCGRNHANMTARVIGMRLDDYKRWRAGKAAQIRQAEQAAAKQRAALNAQETQGTGGGTGTRQPSQP
jgi:cytochrome c oxidase subunit II